MIGWVLRLAQDACARRPERRGPRARRLLDEIGPCDGGGVAAVVVHQDVGSAWDIDRIGDDLVVEHRTGPAEYECIITTLLRILLYDVLGKVHRPFELEAGTAYNAGGLQVPVVLCDNDILVGAFCQGLCCENSSSADIAFAGTGDKEESASGVGLHHGIGAYAQTVRPVKDVDAGSQEDRILFGTGSEILAA